VALEAVWQFGYGVSKGTGMHPSDGMSPNAEEETMAAMRHGSKTESHLWGLM